MSEVLSVRLDHSRKEAITYVSKYSKIGKSEAAKELIDKGREEFASELYKSRKISLEKASKIAGLSISEMMDLLAEKKIQANISMEDFKESLKNLAKISK